MFQRVALLESNNTFCKYIYIINTYPLYVPASDFPISSLESIGCIWLHASKKSWSWGLIFWQAKGLFLAIRGPGLWYQSHRAHLSPKKNIKTHHFLSSSAVLHLTSTDFSDPCHSLQQLSSGGFPVFSGSPAHCLHWLTSLQVLSLTNFPLFQQNWKQIL